MTFELKNIKNDGNLKLLLTEQRGFLKENRDNENSWKEVRDSKNFKMIEVEFPWGKRKTLLPIKTENNYLLQRSRGIDLELEDTDAAMISKLKNSISDIKEIDLIRISEIDAVQKHHNLKEFKNFCEIGFRVPKLQNFYRKRGMNEIGYDINDYNVKLANHLGFNCSVFDLNNSDAKKIELGDSDLIVCYHVLEHLSNPLAGLKQIVDACKKGTFLHIEIPVEPDGPRLWYGHLYPFYPGDMKHMIDSLGLHILYASNETSVKPQGPWVERYSVLT